MGTFLHGGPFTRKSERWSKGSSGNRASLGCSVKGTWRGGSFTGDPEGYVIEGSGDGHLSIGAPLGNLEGVSFTGDFEKWMRQVSLHRGPVGGGAWGEGSIYQEL